MLGQLRETNVNRPAAVHMMTKPGGAICNVDCDPCYFLSKEMLYPGSRFKMAYDLLDKYTKQYIEGQRVPGVTLAWQGRELTLLGLELLKKHRVEVNILTTLHAANAEHPLEVYRFLRDEVGTQFMQFIPIVERDNDTGFQEGTGVTGRSITGKQYGDFLISIYAGEQADLLSRGRELPSPFLWNEG